jgi:hypothetical protein
LTHNQGVAGSSPAGPTETSPIWWGFLLTKMFFK